MNIREVTPEEILGRGLNTVESKNSPRILYISGKLNIPLTSPKCAIVGTREPTSEGKNQARELSNFLAVNNVTVISGLARGIDTEAHRGAIEAGGRTICVLGTPLNKYYPVENKDLQKFISENHLSISQFRAGNPVLPHNFVLRNRTMALLCDASVIVEAGDSSGTLSQGWEALRLGRPLYILHSVFQRKDLMWPEQMMRYGAIRLDDFSLILENLPMGDSNFEFLDV